jgi:cytochrome c5
MSSKQEDFTRVFIWVLAGLVLFTIVVILVARSVGLDENSGPMTDKDIDERTKPYSTVRVAGSDEGSTDKAEPAAAPAQPAAEASKPEPMPAMTEAAEAAPEAQAAASAIDGEALYGACAACHATGAAGAPVLGDAAAWGPRIAGGVDALVSSVMNGKGAMPPKGGRMDLDQNQVQAIVEYMVSQSQ